MGEHRAHHQAAQGELTRFARSSKLKVQSSKLKEFRRDAWNWSLELPLSFGL
jgi:hypothetical protein